MFPAPEILRPHLDPRLAGRQLLRFRIVITSSNLPTQLGHRPLGRKSASRNILQRSSVLSAPKNSLVLTIFDLIFVLIRTSDLLYAQSVEKHSLVNMIARGTRVCTAERRSLSAAVSLGLAVAGDAEGGLLARTLSAGISEAKLAGSVSNRC